MVVYIVSLEWNDPPSEVTGDTGIVGVFATKAAADAAAVAERQRWSADERVDVYQYDNIEGAFCELCGEPAPRDEAGKPTSCQRQHGPDDAIEWCDYCGAELCDSGDCHNDHDDWYIDVHVTKHEVKP
jgi:hypothetical protein